MTSITFATSNNDPKNQNNPIDDPIWTPMRLLDEPLDCNNEHKDLGESGIPPLPQYIVCTEDVEPSGRFLSNVLEGGCFLGTIKNQTTLKAALSKIDNDFGNLYIVGHSDKNAGYICKGKVLISKCLSLAKSKVKTIIFLMCYSSEIAERSYNITQRKFDTALLLHQEKNLRKRKRRKTTSSNSTSSSGSSTILPASAPEMEFYGFVGIGHGCSTSAWGEEEELDLVSSVSLLVKSLSRWPERTWLAIAQGVAIPTSNTMDDNNEEDSTTIMFTCGNAFGKTCHLTAPRVNLSEENRIRLLKSLDMLKREIFEGNNNCLQLCGKEIV